MAVILCFSSQTERGYVGGSAARVALERMGHEVWLLPTVILSNHPGHAMFAGEQVPTGRLRAMLEALQANGWLDEIDAVLTGYLPTPEHVAFAGGMIESVRSAHPDVLVACDPILGDDPGGLYIDETAADAIKRELLPAADLLTPNRFELAWLSGETVGSADDARNAATTLGARSVLASSVPGEAPDTVCNLLTADDASWSTTSPLRADAPHGVGDLLTARYLGHRLAGDAPPDALASASAEVLAAVDASMGSDELRLCTRDADWDKFPAGRVKIVEHT